MEKMASFLTASLWALLSVFFFLFFFLEFVSADQTNIKAEPGQTITLPCRTPDSGTIVFIEWRRTNLDKNVLRFRNGRIDPSNQHPSFKDRVNLKDSQFKDGDVSLVLKNAMIDDSGTYECWVSQGNPEKLFSTVILIVAPPEPIPSWATALLVLLVLVLVAAGLLCHFRHYFMKEYKVEVESGAESVLLPCKTWRIGDLTKDARVEWKDDEDDVVHVYQNGSDQPEEQNQFYSNRTRMNKNLLRTGDLSLTLRRPTDKDSKIYTCSVSNEKGEILMEKQVDLKVKVPQVKAEPGAESVLLPCRTRDQLLKDARVEWRDDEGWKVHVYQNGSDQPEEQNQFYSNRTRMNKDLLRTGDLSLTLRRPTYKDSNIYTCSVSNEKREILMMKQVRLKVKAQQVVVEEGAELVLLPFRTTPGLPEDARVEWRDRRDRTVHVFQNGSDHPEEQNQFYRTRTRMDKDPLGTGDLSLTLMRPTEEEGGDYRCTVWRNDDHLRRTKVKLYVRARTVKVQIQPEDTRTRTSSIDPTPLMADESV